MNVFPAFSNIEGYVTTTINSRFKNLIQTSKLNAWVSIASAKAPGLVLYSNRDGGFTSHYGTESTAGITGKTWGGAEIGGGAEGYKPSPYVSAMEIEENVGSISRKATFTIVAHTQQQCNVLISHFLEPGYTVFLQWGWNTDAANSQLFRDLDGATVAKFSDFAETSKARKNSNGQYDNYLGFITGGGVSRAGDKWEINVKLTGFTELPAYLNAADTITGDDQVEERGGAHYEGHEIENELSLDKKRFMMMFNELPSNRRTESTSKALEEIDEKYMIDVKHYINFDTSVIEELSNKTNFTFLEKFESFLFDNIVTVFNTITNTGDKKLEVDGSAINITAGTKLIHDEKFIRFGALIKIFNLLGATGYALANGNEIQFGIDTTNVPISAFSRIFSVDKGKLFIPNAETPNFSIVEAAELTTPQTDFSKSKNNTIIDSAGEIVQFPQRVPLPTELFPNAGDLTRNSGEWGYLNDLYVNFDFAKSIMETKNFSLKDATYQLLNGLSAAAGGQWDFQLQETGKDNKSKLTVVDYNLVSTGEKKPTISAVFDISGTESPFIDNTLDLDIGGNMMNKIIGERLSGKLNSSTGVSESGNLGTTTKDFVLTKLNVTKKITSNSPSSGATGYWGGTAEDDKALKKKNFELFMELVGIYPQVQYTKDTIKNNISFDEFVYIGALNDLEVLESLKLKKEEATDKTGIGALTNIKFSFTVHGVSGIKRGDKFRINGLPSDYTNKGFFQVMDIKHNIDGMMWKTEVTGGWRPFRQKPPTT